MSKPRWFTPALAASLFVVASPTQPRAYAQTDARGHSLAPRQEPEPGDTAAALAARVARATAAWGRVEAAVSLAGETLWHGARAGDGRREVPVGQAFPARDLLRPALSLAVLRLVGREAPEGGVVALDRPIGVYLAAAKPLGDDVTVRRLLAGTSGVTAYEAELDRERRTSATVGSLVELVAAAGTVTTPGSCFDPNESEVLLVGALVEAVTGTKLEVTLAELFQAAGLAGTGFRADTVDARPSEASAAVGAADAGLLAPFGEDRLVTTAPDLARLTSAVASRELLDEEMLAELIAPARLGSGAPTGSGLGVELVRLGELAGAAIGGSGDAAWRVMRYPDADLTLVVVCFAQDTAGAGESVDTLCRDLARVALGLPPPGVLDLPLDVSVAAAFVGEYLSGCDRVTVTQGRDGRLVLTLGTRLERVLLHQGGVRFLARGDEELEVEFRWREGEPRAAGFVLREHGLFVEAVRVP